MKFIKSFFITAFIITFVFFNQNLNTATYGSDAQVGVYNAFAIPTASNNIIRTFGCVKNGFAFQDLNTSCTFQSIFPVAGPISLKGGKLYLMSDLILSNTGTFADLGTIIGANHVVELSQYNTTFNSGTQPNGKLILNTAASVTLSRLSRSFDWSYDGKYLAVGITSGTGSDLYIYEFTGTSLISRANLNISATPNSVRWHPNSYYLAITASATPFIRSYQFTPPTTLTARGTVAGTASLLSVAWQARGTHVAVGGTTATGISVYSYSTGTGNFTLSATSTNSAALGGTVQYDSIHWAPTGSKNDIIATTYSSATVGTVHLYNFTGAALNHLKAYAQAKGAYALDWSPTATYIAVGFSDGTLRTYQHTAATNNTIAQKQSATITGAVNSINWKYDASELAVARATAAVNDFQIYSFNTGTYALLEKYPIALTTDAYCTRFYYNSTTQSSYVARSDNSTRLLIVYKESYSPFIFRDVNLFLNGDLTLSAPLTFTGNCTISGRNSKITFTGDGTLNIAQDSNLEISQTTLDFTSPSAFSLQGGTSNLKLKNSTINLSSDIVLGDGKFEVYNDLTVTGPHEFLYSSNYTSTIHANSTLSFKNGANFKIGKTRATNIEPLEFENNSSQLNLDNATLHVTGSGLRLKKGIINIFNKSVFDIDWTDTTQSKISQGIVLGDGIKSSNDPQLRIQGNGSSIEIKNGGATLDPATTTSIVQFLGQSQILLDNNCFVYVQRPVNVTAGWFMSDTTAIMYVDPAARVVSSDTRFTSLLHTQDYYMSGSIATIQNLTLDKNDLVLLTSGIFGRNITVKDRGNKISGVGGFAGNLIFTDYKTSLTWDIATPIDGIDVDLKGGRIIFTQDSGITHTYSFKNTGSIDLTNQKFDFGAEEVDWSANLYWIGSDAIMRLNCDTNLTGVWTFSGSVLIDGQGYELDLENTGTIILERGAQLSLKNMKIENVSRHNGIVCKDNTGTVKFENAIIALGGDYLFNKGGLFFSNNNQIVSNGSHDTFYTFTYDSIMTSTIYENSTLEVLDGVKLTVGRKNSAKINPTQQPIIFSNAASTLYLNGGTLHITTSGLILTTGILQVTNKSTLEVGNSKYEYGLVMGDGIQADDFLLDITSGSELTIKSGRLYYNNKLSDRINFASQESAIHVETQNGLYAKNSIILESGSLATPLATTIATAHDANKYVKYNNMHRYDYNHSMDFYVTGTPLSTPDINLATNDGILIYASTLNRNINIINGNNKISGIGNLAGAITFNDHTSTLTWDLATSLGTGNISLNGGRIRVTQDTGFTNNYVFQTTGTVDMTTKKISLSPEESTWNGNVYWIGDGATIALQNNVYLDGTWTLSGNIIIDGNEYLIDLGTTGSIILEHGATLNLKNISLLNLDQEQRFHCKDNNCQIIMNNAEFVLSGDYLFDKGSIYIYYDSDINVISPEGTSDFIYTFSYTSNKPFVIDSLCNFRIFEGVRYSTGRNNSLVTAPELQPLNFTDPLTSKFILQGGTLHITSSGIILTKGTLEVADSSSIEVENTVYPYGLVLGNGTAADDFKLELEAGVKLTLLRGKIFYNNNTDSNIIFDSPESSLAIEGPRGLHVKRNLTLSQGSISAPLPTSVCTMVGPGVNLTYNNMHRYDYGHLQDYYITGTQLNLDTTSNTYLVSDGHILINPGSFNRDVSIVDGGNYLSGIGNVLGLIYFTDYHSSLTWDIPQLYTAGDIDLKGGRIIFTQDSGLGGAYSFKSSGSVDLGNQLLQLGTETTEWNSNIYWIGDGAILRLNNDALLSGIWTLSGNILIDGTKHLLDLTNSGTIILERGAHVTFKDIGLSHLTRQTRIICKDNNCKITLNNVDLLMTGDYLFEKGSIFVYWDSRIGAISGLDTVYTFSYASTQTSTIDVSASLEILPGARLSIGRRDSTITNINRQPLVFNDPETSQLILGGGTLHVTSSGMILTKGILNVANSSKIEIENSVYPYGLVMGDGAPANDFELTIGGGYQLEIAYGSIFYNNHSPNRVIFGSPASSIDIKGNNGFYAKKDITLKNGSLYTSGVSSVAISKDSNVDVIQDNILRSYTLPAHSVQKRKVHGVRPYIMYDGDYYYVTEGYTTNDVIAYSGLSNFGGTAGFGGTLTLNNPSVSLQCALGTPLFCSPTLNGGTFILASDLSFASDKNFTGSGKVQLLGTKLAFGSTTDMSMTNTIYWQGVTKGGIALNAQKTSLSSSWTFGGNIVLNGNGNILDLSNRGIITIRPNSTLSLENIALKGLGQNHGSINFMDDTATLRLSNAYLELDNNLSTTIGGILINGPTFVALKNYNWTLDQNASMTIDGAPLWQEPLDKNNYGKIKFGTGSLSKYLSLVSSGTIKTTANLDMLRTSTTSLQTQVKNSSNAIGSLSDHFVSVGGAKLCVLNNISGNTTLQGTSMLENSIDLNGGTLTLNGDLIMSSQSNILSSGNLNLNGHAIIFDGDFNLADNVKVKVTSNGKIDGRGNSLDIANRGKLIVDNGITVTLKNLNLSSESSWPIEMRSPTSSLVLHGIITVFERDFTFTQGKLFIHEDVLISGSNKFSYASTSTSYIDEYATLYFDMGTTFSYSPRISGRHTLSERNLIKMADKTSSIVFDQCNIKLPDSGWQLTRGSLYFDNKVTLTSGYSKANSFEWGDGTSVGDISVNLLAGANIKNYGCIYYNPPK